MKQLKSSLRRHAISSLVNFSPSFMLKRYVKLSDFFAFLAESVAIREEGGIHPKHEIMRYYTFFQKHIQATDTVLDVGSNHGALTIKLAAVAKSVVGVEIDKNNYEMSVQRHSAPNIEYIHGDFLTYQPAQKFGVCVMSNVLEHIEDRVAALKKAKEISKVLLVRVPTIDRDWWPRYKKKLGLEWRSDGTHFIEHTEEELRAELTAAGWTIDVLEHKWGEMYCRCV